MTDLDNIKE